MVNCYIAIENKYKKIIEKYLPLSVISEILCILVSLFLPKSSLSLFHLVFMKATCFHVAFSSEDCFLSLTFTKFHAYYPGQI